MSTTNTLSSTAAPAAAQAVVPTQDQGSVSNQSAKVTAVKVNQSTNSLVARFQEQSPAFLKNVFPQDWTALTSLLDVEK